MDPYFSSSFLTALDCFLPTHVLLDGQAFERFDYGSGTPILCRELRPARLASNCDIGLD